MQHKNPELLARKVAIANILSGHIKKAPKEKDGQVFHQDDSGLDTLISICQELQKLGFTLQSKLVQCVADLVVNNTADKKFSLRKVWLSQHMAILSSKLYQMAQLFLNLINLGMAIKFSNLIQKKCISLQYTDVGEFNYYRQQQQVDGKMSNLVQSIPHIAQWS